MDKGAHKSGISGTSVPALSPSATGLLTIDLGAIRRNYHKLSGLVAPAECAAVVKADAYGLGLTQVVPALAAAGCRTFFVASLAEARTSTNLGLDV